MMLKFALLLYPMLLASSMNPGNADGPYVFINGSERSAIYIRNGEPVIQKDINAVAISFPQHPDWSFDVGLIADHKNEPAVFPAPDKLLVLSDIEGEFEALRSLLIGNKVIDQQYRWRFGKGQLLIAGDLFDRGIQVPECMWLLYKLEQEAKAKGGYVHVLLGNHDIMNLSGDLRYVPPKYFESAKLMGRDYMELYGLNTELGRWLRSKNIVEKIGDLLVLHAGISSEILSLNLSVEKVNELSRPYYAIPKKDLPEQVNVFFGKDSPFWFRGYFLEPRVSMTVIDQTLKQYGCNKIIVGHTIVDKNVALYYQGKVLAVDVDEHAGYRAGALFLRGKWYKVDDTGKRVLLEYNPANDEIKAEDIL